MNAALSSAAVVVRRTIDASPEVLFDAWLDPIALSSWMRPGAALRTEADVDARVGGRFSIVMHSATATTPHTGVYRAIDRPKRLVFTWFSPHTDDRDTLVTVDFVPKDGRRTEIVITHEQLSEVAGKKHDGGWTSALEKLDAAYGASAVKAP